MSDVEATNELKNLGTQALKDLYDNLTNAKGFVLDQAPDFLRQIVAYGIAESVVILVASAAFIIVWLFVLSHCFRKNEDDRSSDWDTAAFVVLVVGGCGAVVAIVIGVVSLLTLAKATFAPKLYLVEYIAHLLK